MSEERPSGGERPSGEVGQSGEVRRVPLARPDGADRWSLEEAGHRYAAFVLDDGTVTVVDGDCPHRGGPLVEGVVRDGAVVCPWHWYTYDLRTGFCRTTEAQQIQRYPVIEVDGVAMVEMPVRRKRSWAELLHAHARGES